MVKQHGDDLYTLFDQNLKPIVQNVLFLYDDATNKIVSFIKVITTKQSEITDYVNKTYSKVQVSVQDNWMRLDFDKDGEVSTEDLKKSMHSLYEFLINYDVLEKTTQIKGQLYTEAIAFMQKELDEDKK